MKRLIIAVLLLLALCGCESGKDISPHYPRIEYLNSSYNFDPFNREITVDDGFVLDEGHSFDFIQTENGYDVVLHFVKEDTDVH